MRLPSSRHWGALLCGFGAVIVVGLRAVPRDAARSARLLDEVLTTVSLRFVTPTPTESLYVRAARGVVTELHDPYSELLSPARQAQFSRETSGRYSGVGIGLLPGLDGWIVVDHVYPGTPAEAEGVREGDRIVAVDGEAVRGWTTDRLQTRLLGARGTRVTVTFERPGLATPRLRTFARADIHVSSVPFAVMLDSTLGYVPVRQFGEDAAADVQRAIATLRARGATGIVLDVRGNRGGLVDEAIALANLFLPKGAVIVTVRSRGEDERAVAAQEPVEPTIPLVLLVDDGSASASEIVAGALQDHDRAVVLGATTFGKGLVQSVYALDGGYALKLTTGKWFTPLGRSIHRDRPLVREEERTAAVLPRADADAPPRPTFTTAKGRTLRGGGAIVPDLEVADDSLTSSEQAFRRALLPHLDVFREAVWRVAERQRGRVSVAFRVDTAWRAEVMQRLQRTGVVIDSAMLRGAHTDIERALEERVAKVAFGDTAVFRRQLPYDAPLRTAQQLLRTRRTTEALLAALPPQRL